MAGRAAGPLPAGTHNSPQLGRPCTTRLAFLCGGRRLRRRRRRLLAGAALVLVLHEIALWALAAAGVTAVLSASLEPRALLTFGLVAVLLLLRLTLLFVVPGVVLAAFIDWLGAIRRAG